MFLVSLQSLLRLSTNKHISCVKIIMLSQTYPPRVCSQGYLKMNKKLKFFLTMQQLSHCQPSLKLVCTKSLYRNFLKIVRTNIYRLIAEMDQLV